jgi:hypothetical protein
MEVTQDSVQFRAFVLVTLNYESESQRVGMSIKQSCTRTVLIASRNSWAI